MDDIDLSNNLHNNIEIRPKLIGGSEDFSIICANVNGYPSTKNNQNKVPEISKLIKGHRAVIALETGVNEQEKMLDLFEEINIAKENKMKTIEKNQQYQHNGGGTAILLDRNINYQDTRVIFNNDKAIS